MEELSEKRKNSFFRRIEKNELRRSERENRVGFPGRVNICVQEKIRGGERAEKRRGKRVVEIGKFVKRFEEEEQSEEEENASSNSSPLHHESYGAAASEGGVEDFNSDRLSSDILHSISSDVGKSSRI